MARSHAVWVVLGPAASGVNVGETLLATFTVKHELVTWLGRWPDAAALVEAGRVWRCGDGLCQEDPRQVSREELA